MGALTKHCGEIKVVISLEALLFYIYHYHSINHKDGISCLQLEWRRRRRGEGGGQGHFFPVVLLLSCWHIPLQRKILHIFSREVVRFRK